ncbi:hypothetical protein Q3G72_031410 [Acer saccharum]|nr:hypothetical protein Q3G72_031410 [Acer saccharum]
MPCRLGASAGNPLPCLLCPFHPEQLPTQTPFRFWRKTKPGGFPAFKTYPADLLQPLNPEKESGFDFVLEPHLIIGLRNQQKQDSSCKIKILVLDSDFGSEGNENWTEQEFNAKIVCQREGKEPLVKGKQKIMLTDGVGTIQDLCFSDNSSWTKCKKFRLGARALQSTSNMGQVRIKEAISEAFTVRHHRVKNKF